MKLFNDTQLENILPYDGTVIYYGTVIDNAEATDYYHKFLKTIEWKHDEAFIFGKRYVTKRMAAWYADTGFHYTYSRVTKIALPWTPELLELKTLAEQVTGAAYNSCLLNLYHDGTEAMAWHSDDEKTLAKDSAIASFTFGAERKFAFRHKVSKETRSLILEHGSLLVMKDTTQANWVHRLTPSAKVASGRINLTFRCMQQ